MAISEETLSGWTKPLSETEEERVENTIAMIRAAVETDAFLKSQNLEIFLQGSYANNTNVRAESDVDICVMNRATIGVNYVPGYDDRHYHYHDSTINFPQYREAVKRALINKFGTQNVHDGNKSIKIDENTYHVKADVVPAFQYRDYAIINSLDRNRFIEGIKFYSRNGRTVINYPKVHIKNGKIKNENTNHNYKRFVRIMKHLKNDMTEAGLIDGDKISSFLVECLVWNFPNQNLESITTWNWTIEEFLYFLLEIAQTSELASWKEVSDILPLFSPERKWTTGDVVYWANQALEYLG